MNSDQHIKNNWNVNDFNRSQSDCELFPSEELPSFSCEYDDDKDEDDASLNRIFCPNR